MLAWTLEEPALNLDVAPLPERTESLGAMTGRLLEQVDPNRPVAPPSGPGSRLGKALEKLAAKGNPSHRANPLAPVSGFAQPLSADPDLFDALPQFETFKAEQVSSPQVQNVRHVEVPQKELSASDRRAHPRHDSECLVWVTLRPPHLTGSSGIDGEADPGRIRGKVVDVSMGGFAVRLLGPVVPGHRIWLSISNRLSAEALQTEASVLRCTPQPSGDWHVVCRLTRRLTYEQVNFIGKQLFASTLV